MKTVVFMFTGLAGFVVAITFAFGPFGSGLEKTPPDPQTVQWCELKFEDKKAQADFAGKVAWCIESQQQARARLARRKFPHEHLAFCGLKLGTQDDDWNGNWSGVESCLKFAQDNARGIDRAVE